MGLKPIKPMTSSLKFDVRTRSVGRQDGDATHLSFEEGCPVPPTDARRDSFWWGNDKGTPPPLRPNGGSVRKLSKGAETQPTTQAPSLPERVKTCSPRDSPKGPRRRRGSSNTRFTEESGPEPGRLRFGESLPGFQPTLVGRSTKSTVTPDSS